MKGFNMAMNEIMKWQKSVEKAKVARSKAKQCRRDNQDLKNAGVYISPDEKYRDEFGYIRPDAPQWYKNIQGAWETNRKIRQTNSTLKADGHAPVKRKRKKKTMDQKPRKVKIKRSVQMNVLLQGHGISVNVISGTITGYEEFTFLQNGRIRTPENDVISVFQFIHDYV